MKDFNIGLEQLLNVGIEWKIVSRDYHRFLLKKFNKFLGQQMAVPVLEGARKVSEAASWTRWFDDSCGESRHSKREASVFYLAFLPDDDCLFEGDPINGCVDCHDFKALWVQQTIDKIVDQVWAADSCEDIQYWSSSAILSPSGIGAEPRLSWFDITASEN